jgi:hypothetical protein
MFLFMEGQSAQRGIPRSTVSRKERHPAGHGISCSYGANAQQCCTLHATCGCGAQRAARSTAVRRGAVHVGRHGKARSSGLEAFDGSGRHGRIYRTMKSHLYGIVSYFRQYARLSSSLRETGGALRSEDGPGRLQGRREDGTDTHETI